MTFLICSDFFLKMFWIKYVCKKSDFGENLHCFHILKHRPRIKPIWGVRKKTEMNQTWIILDIFTLGWISLRLLFRRFPGSPFRSPIFTSGPRVGKVLHHMVYLRIFGEEFHVQLLDPWKTRSCYPDRFFFFREIVRDMFFLDFTKWDFQWDLPNGIFLWKVVFNGILGDSIGFPWEFEP